MLTACILTCNELVPIQRCLASINGHVDHVIVAVDDKTNDGTHNWLRDNNYFYYIFHFNDSFSEARNHCVEQVRTPWFFTIDSDEVMLPHDAARLREACREGDRLGVDAWTMGRRHWFDLEMTQEWTYPYPDRHFRLMRNYVRYEGKVHEQYINWKNRMDSNIELQHFNLYYRGGFNGQKWEERNKLYRRLEKL